MSSEKGKKKTKQIINDAVNKIMNYLYRRVPEWAIGRTEDWKIKLYSQCCAVEDARETEKRIEGEKRKLLKSYCVVLIVGILVLIGFSVSERSEDLPASIERPAYGEEGYSLPLEAEISYKGETYRESVSLAVRPKQITEGEKQAQIRHLAKELPKRIRGENQSLSHVKKPLKLFTKDEETGISLRWFSENPERIDEKGRVDLIEMSAPEHVLLKAELRLGDRTEDVYIETTLVPMGEGDDYTDSIGWRLEKTMALMEQDLKKASIRLPEWLGEGISTEWSRSGSGSGVAAIPVLCLAVCFWLFRGRYGALERESRNRREHMRREFPELVNQIVLLLNAGLVVSAALFEVADTASDEENRQKSPLFYELSRIADRARRTNTSFTKELIVFSQASGIRELIRFSAIVADNVDKGSSLAEKLEGEGELLRTQQRRLAEEKARLAETKLSFPLMLLLMILILIAVAPVMFEV